MRLLIGLTIGLCLGLAVSALAEWDGPSYQQQQQTEQLRRLEFQQNQMRFQQQLDSWKQSERPC